MKKVIIIGCPGSGKSTFSRELHIITKLPLYHLDLIYWNKDKTIVEKSIFLNELSKILKKEEWIIDGNYGSTMEQRIKEADTVFFLDYHVDICLEGVLSRVGKPRSDLPWAEDELDDEFLNYIKNYNMNSRPLVLELLKKYHHKNIIIFKTREDANKYLLNLKGV